VIFTVLGAPRTKKCHQRILRFGRFNKVVPSTAWMAFRDIAVPQLRRQWQSPPIEVDVNCRATFYRDRAVGDAVGFYQSIADVLEEAGVVADDKHIVSWNGSRLDKDASRPRIEIELTQAA
jgi:Holliday junction resolvase RusA-like endonuclease